MLVNGISYPLTDGADFSFASVEFNANGQTFTAVDEITFGRKRNRDMNRGVHPDPLSKTTGENEYEASATVKVAEFVLWRSQLGQGYGDIFFSATVILNSPALGTTETVLVGCSLDEETWNMKSGPAGIPVKINLRPLKIIGDGFDDCAVPLLGIQSSGLLYGSGGAGSGTLAPGA